MHRHNPRHTHSVPETACAVICFLLFQVLAAHTLCSLSPQSAVNNRNRKTQRILHTQTRTCSHTLATQTLTCNSKINIQTPPFSCSLLHFLGPLRLGFSRCRLSCTHSWLLWGLWILNGSSSAVTSASVTPTHHEHFSHHTRLATFWSRVWTDLLNSPPRLKCVTGPMFEESSRLKQHQGSGYLKCPSMDAVCSSRGFWWLLIRVSVKVWLIYVKETLDGRE